MAQLSILGVLIVLHSPAGVAMDLNTQEITAMRNPEPSNKNFTPTARCMINLTDGKFVTVRETCDEVKRLMEKK